MIYGHKITSQVFKGQNEWEGKWLASLVIGWGKLPLYDGEAAASRTKVPHLDFG